MLACQQEVIRRRETFIKCTENLQQWSKTQKAKEERVAQLKQQMNRLQAAIEERTVRLEKARGKVEQASATDAAEIGVKRDNADRPADEIATPMDPSQRAQNAMNRAFEKGQRMQRDLDTRFGSTVSDGESKSAKSLSNAKGNMKCHTSYSRVCTQLLMHQRHQSSWF